MVDIPMKVLTDLLGLKQDQGIVTNVLPRTEEDFLEDKVRVMCMGPHMAPVPDCESKPQNVPARFEKKECGHTEVTVLKFH